MIYFSTRQFCSVAAKLNWGKDCERSSQPELLNIFFNNVSGEQLESTYHQHRLTPSLFTGSATTTGISRSLVFKCFSSCIQYTKCIENVFIEWCLVPAIKFIKGSLVKHNHCCFLGSLLRRIKRRKVMPAF